MADMVVQLIEEEASRKVRLKWSTNFSHEAGIA